MTMLPDERQVQDFYDGEYYADIQGAGEPTGHHRRLVKRLGIASGDAVVDIACGTGEWLAAAREQGARVAGIDLASRAIDFCRARMPEGEFYCQGATQLPFPDASADLVTCLGSLEHFPDKSAALREMYRIVRPGSALVFSVPNSDFLGYRLGLYKGTNQAGVIETPLPVGEWEHLGLAAGFNCEERWRDLHFVNLGWMSQSGAWLALPRACAALAIAALPLSLQYQVYFRFRKPA